MTWKGISRASAREAGFSLVELLVSLAVLGMLGALLASGLGLSQKVWRRSEEKSQASRAMFDAQAALRRLLDNLQPLRAADQGSREIEFRGSPDELEGIVPLPPHIGLGGLYRLHLFRSRAGRRLALTFRAFEQGTARTNATGDDAGLTTLATEIEGWNFAISAKQRERRHQSGGAIGRARKSFRHSSPLRSRGRERASFGRTF